MKILLYLLFLFFYDFALGQTEYLIDRFSDDYYGKIIIEEGYENEIFKKGQILILQKNTDEAVIRIVSDELAFGVNQDGGKVKINVKELPYGDQSVLISEDFNFDGKKDLAIQDGQYSCYHLPSYQVYLYAEGGYNHSPEFTRLAQEYCGMFQTDAKDKTIHTMVKSGCCWHQYSTFIVQNNLPKLKFILETSRKLVFETTKVQLFEDGMMKEEIRKVMHFDLDQIKDITSFNLADSKKKIVLFNFNNRTLNFAILKEGNVVEFNYPAKAVYRNPDFQLAENENMISFEDDGVHYQVYKIMNNGIVKNLGVKINRNDGIISDLKGDINSFEGDFSRFKNLDNVVIEK